MFHFRSLPKLVSILAALLLSGVATAAPTLYSVRSNADDHLYRIDAATGVATDLGLIGFGDAEGLAFAGSTLYAIGGTDDQFWNITAPPGVLVGTTGPRAGIDAGLDFNARTGIMYNRNSDVSSGTLYTIDLATGAATLVGGDNIFTDGLAINSSGDAFGIDGIFTDSLYSISLVTGAATLIGGLGLGDIGVLFGLTFAEGVLYALSSEGDIYTVNTSTGAATLVASTTCGGIGCAGWEGLAALQVPAPGSLLLVALAIFALGLRRKLL